MSNTFCISENVVSTRPFQEDTLTSDQLVISQSLRMFCVEATNGYALCGMTLGRIVGSLAHFRSFSLFSKIFGQSKAAQISSHILSKGIGLFGEGATFHLAPGLLQTGTIFQAGALSGSLSSTLTIAACQSVSLFGLPSNLVFQHLAQNCAILGAHRVSATFGWSEKESGPLFQELLLAEVANWQISAGACLTRVVAPNATYLEASIYIKGRVEITQTHSLLKRTFRSLSQRFQQSLLPEPAEGMKEELIRAKAREIEKEKFSGIFFAEGKGEGKGSSITQDSAFIEVLEILKSGGPETSELATQQGVQIISSRPLEERLEPARSVAELLEGKHYPPPMDIPTSIPRALGRIAPHLSAPDRLQLVQEMIDRAVSLNEPYEIQDPDELVGIVSALGEMVPFLPRPEDRSTCALTISHFASRRRDYCIVIEETAEAVRKIVPTLKLADRLAPTLVLIRPMFNIWMIGSGGKRARSNCWKEIQPKTLEGWFKETGATTGIAQKKAKEKVQSVVESIFSVLSPEQRTQFIREWFDTEDALSFLDSSSESKSLRELLERMIPQLPRDLLPIIDIIFPWGVGRTSDLRGTVKTFAVHLRKRDLVALAVKTVTAPNMMDYSKQYGFFERELIPLMDWRDRMRCVEAFVVLEPKLNNSTFLDSVKLLTRGLSTEVLNNYVHKHPNPDLIRVARYHEARLPWDRSVWENYVEAQDPEAWIAQTQQDIAAFRRGKRLTNRFRPEISLAHAGLDNPEDLDAWDLERMIRHERELPPLFLEKPFTMQVVEIKGTPPKALIDRTKIAEALKPVVSLYSHILYDENDPHGLYHPTEMRVGAYRQSIDLFTLLQNELGFPDSVLANLTNELIDDGKYRRCSPSEIKTIESIQPYLLFNQEGGVSLNDPLIKQQNSKTFFQHLRPLLPQVREIFSQGKSASLDRLITQIVVYFGDNGTFGERAFFNRVDLRDYIYPQEYAHVPSRKVIQFLKDLEEFYRDTLSDVTRELGLDNDQIIFINQQRAALKAELAKIKNEGKRETTLVEAIPSKCEADEAFPKVSKDCNEGIAIYHPDFQLYRLIAHERLVGLLYLQKATLDRKQVLVIGIQPRTFWNIDHASLLNEVREQLPSVLSTYDYILLVRNKWQQSNRVDMQDAIETAGLEPIEFKEAISGTIFSGNDFWVLGSKKRTKAKRKKS